MNVENVKGMRDVPTTQGLRNRSSAAPTREQAVTELARLEHEKARLERELKMWQANEKKTSLRIVQVQARLVVLQQILDPALTPKNPAKKRKTRESTDGEHAGQAWQEVKLEY